MKKIMVIGKTSCGKTTLCQLLSGDDMRYKKTQAVEIVGCAIDTPGEYLERKSFTNALIVSAVDADVILLLQSCKDLLISFSPGMGSMFNKPIIGIVTKIDLAESAEEIKSAAELLKLAGAEKIFSVSCLSKKGIDALKKYLT